jgi:hypothetical protein
MLEAIIEIKYRDIRVDVDSQQLKVIYNILKSNLFFNVAELFVAIWLSAADKSGKWCILELGEADSGDRRVSSVRRN